MCSAGCMSPPLSSVACLWGSCTAVAHTRVSCRSSVSCWPVVLIVMSVGCSAPCCPVGACLPRWQLFLGVHCVKRQRGAWWCCMRDPWVWWCQICCGENQHPLQQQWAGSNSGVACHMADKARQTQGKGGGGLPALSTALAGSLPGMLGINLFVCCTVGRF